MKKSSKSMEAGQSCCGGCCTGACPKCHAFTWLIVGVIFLINYYATFADWWMLIGVLLVLKGILKLIMPYCSHCR